MEKTVQPLLDDYSAGFVRWLTIRTLEGRARWEKHPSGLISHLACSMFAQFITRASERGQVWRLFRVRDSNGELLRAAPPVPTADASPLALAVEALFLTIIWSGRDLIH